MVHRMSGGERMSKEQQKLLEMLDGCINRICVTDDRDELKIKTIWAIRYIMKLNDMRDREIFYRETYRDEEGQHAE
jgi:hypothetical protein